MASDKYSLMRGGLVHRMLDRVGALRPGVLLSRWIAGLLLGVSFVPLVVATWLNGTLLAGSVDVPLLGDYAVLSRFLLALPVLVLAAPYSDALLRGAMRQLSHSNLVRASQRAALDALLARTRRLRDAALPEFVCLAVALLPLLNRAPAMASVPGLSDWRTAADGVRSAAGHWLEWASMPMFRFVALLWLWRFVLWAYLLWRLARIRPDLHPGHPDGAGGIGFLGIAQGRFGILALAGGLLVSGTCINHIAYAGQNPFNLSHLLIGYAVAATAVLLAPLLLLAPAMLRVKRHALLKFDALGNRALHEFDRRWRRGQVDPDAASLLDQGDASALADFTAIYGTVRSMSVVPLSRWMLLWMALHAALPLLPLVFFAMSLDELAKRLFSILA